MKFILYIILTCFVNIVFFFSIFDIYFTSPVIKEAKSFPPDVIPIASRLVLFVADGLRADKLFSLNDNKISRSPFLRNIMLHQGVWGVIHAQAPTESRPCHVAMTSGFNEDASAIYKGWKENPVEFDSIFNQSRYTWAFGNYEVIPIFSKGDASSHYQMHIYYGNSNDEWVVNEFFKFLLNAGKDMKLKSLLHENRIIFFFHMVATDTLGHRHGSSSYEYVSNINKVDSVVSRIVDLINNFYLNDGRTTYIFVSDHGMSDAGSHGSGSRSETESPLLVWGAGIRNYSANMISVDKYELERTRLWGLDHTLRHDINQVDLAPFMASLVGLASPSSSIGILPIDVLSINAELKAKLMFANAKQICELFKIKKKSAHQNSLLVFPFLKLSLLEVSIQQQHIFKLIEEKFFDKAIAECRKLMKLSIEGVHYYHIYHRFSLYFVLILSYAGWILVSFIVFFKASIDLNIKNSTHGQIGVKNLIIFVIGCSSVVITFIHNSFSIAHYIYYMLPLFIWFYIIENHIVLWCGFQLRWSLKKFLLIILYTVAIVFSMYFRQVLTAFTIGFGVQGFFSNIALKKKLVWCICSIVSSIFPLLPVVAKDFQLSLVMLACFTMVILCLCLLSKKCFLFSFFCIASGIVLYILEGNSRFVMSIVCWVFVVISFFLLMFLPNKPYSNIFILFAFYFSGYIFVSISYDALFFVVVILHLYSWIMVEFELSHNRIKHLDNSVKVISANDEISWIESCGLFDYLQTAYIFLFFLVFTVFGVENIKSLDDFDFKHSINIFGKFLQQPFLKFFLLFIKIALPILTVLCSIDCIVVTTNMSLQKLCCCINIIAQILALPFLFMIRDSGSWADIGGSIARYVIVTSLVFSSLFLVVLHYLKNSQLLLNLFVRKHYFQHFKEKESTSYSKP